VRAILNREWDRVISECCLRSIDSASNRIEADQMSLYVGTKKAPARSGFRQEGTPRLGCLHEGEWRDEMCFALLMEEAVFFIPIVLSISAIASVVVLGWLFIWPSVLWPIRWVRRLDIVRTLRERSGR
jgi:hypothetical protein